MPQYRIYCLNQEGRFSKAFDVEAADDAAALAEARALDHPNDCEVWNGGRLVGTVPGTSVAGS